MDLTEEINKEMDEYIEYLKKKELRLKKKVTFTTDDELDKLIEEIKDLDIVFIE